MAVTKCPECGGTISDSVRTCIHCGANLAPCYNCGGLVKVGEGACPHCGSDLEWHYDDESKKKEKGDDKLGCWGWLGIIFVLVILGNIVDKCGGSDDSSATDDADATKVEQVIQAPATEEGTTTDSQTNNDYVQAQLESTMSRELKHYYRDFSKLIKLEELPSTSDYNYKFTIEEKLEGGLTCKQEGFIRCYADGEVSDVISYGDPFDFRDNKGNEVHDRTGYGLY